MFRFAPRQRIRVGAGALHEERDSARETLFQIKLRVTGVIPMQGIVVHHGVVAGVAEQDCDHPAVSPFHRQHGNVLIHRPGVLPVPHAPAIDGEPCITLPKGKSRRPEVRDGLRDRVE